MTMAKISVQTYLIVIILVDCMLTADTQGWVRVLRFTLIVLCSR